MSTLLQDLRFGLRVLLRDRSFSVAAIAALALGIGANSAIFSVIYGVLLKPLPYRDPQRLVRVYEYNPVERFQNFPLAPANFVDYRRENGVFQDIATYVRQDLQFSGDRPERLTTVRVSSGFFRLFGFEPLLGRAFTPEEEAKKGPTDTAIISYAVWKRLFGGDPQVIGKTIWLTDSPFQIVGVMPAEFEHVSGGYKLPRGEGVDVWLPFDRLGNPRGLSRANHFCNTIARLKPGVRLEEAQAAMNVAANRLAAQFPDDKNWRIQLTPLQADLVGKARPTLFILAGAVGFVLLVACVNVANLLLARATVRSREMAIRAAVGATRARLVRQMLTESITLATIGGALGLILAWSAVRALVALGPDQVPRLRAVSLDPRVVFATVVLSVLAGVLFGLAPALAASTDFRRSRPRGMFVIAEVALTFVLLVGAGLLLRSFLALGRVDPGFNPHGVLTMNTTLSWAKLEGARRYTAFYERFVENLAQLPGVTAAGSSSNLPWTGANDNALFGIEGRLRQPNATPHAYYQFVSPDYLRAIGVPLLAGRWLAASDHFDAPRVVVVNRALALQHWPSVEACIGQRIYTLRDTNTPDTFMTIVGVAGDVKDSPSEPHAQPVLYEASLQNPSFGDYLAVRSTVDPVALIPAVRELTRQMGNDLSIQEIRPMEQVVASAVATQRFALQMVGLFAVVALLLALIGIYGVMSYAITRRSREIAIRVALGAQWGDTLRLLLGHGVRLIFGGLVVGGLAAAALTRVLAGMLFQVTPTDPLTFAAVAAALAAVATAACFGPARRALSIDPIEALRHE